MAETSPQARRNGDIFASVESAVAVRGDTADYFGSAARSLQVRR